MAEVSEIDGPMIRKHNDIYNGPMIRKHNDIYNSSPYQSSPLLISRAFVPHPAGGILSRWSSPAFLDAYWVVGGGRACSASSPLLSLTVEHLKVRVYLLVWGVNSRACLRILNSRACLRILISRACLRILSDEIPLSMHASGKLPQHRLAKER
jgi:hypothetical protein